MKTKTGTNSPSRKTSLQNLYFLRENNYKGLNGFEYDMGEVEDLILEKETNAAAKIEVDHTAIIRQAVADYMASAAPVAPVVLNQKYVGKFHFNGKKVWEA